jgi:hypothetical protein
MSEPPLDIDMLGDPGRPAPTAKVPPGASRLPAPAVVSTAPAPSTTTVSDLLSVLDSIRPTARSWQCHPGTGVLLHTDETPCQPCMNYILHLQKEKESNSPSLLDALESLEHHWLTRLDNHPDTIDTRDRAYRDGKRDGRREAEKDWEKGRARTDSAGKGKARATEPELELEQLKESHEKTVRECDSWSGRATRAEKELRELHATYLTLLGENRRLVDENLNLKTQIASTQGMHIPLDYGLGPDPYSAGAEPVIPAREEDYDILMGNAPSPSSSGPPPAPKRKLGEEVGGPSSKRPRGAVPVVQLPDGTTAEIRDGRTGLPMPIDFGGNPYLSGRAWSRISTECLGRTQAKKVEWLCSNRHLPLYSPLA